MSNIVEIIGGYVNLKKSGHKWTGRCPFHREKTPSFVVDPKAQTFECLGCGVEGDVDDFKALMQKNVAARNEKDAQSSIAHRYRGPIMDYGEDALATIPCPYCNHYGKVQFCGSLFQVTTCISCEKEYLVKWTLHHELYKLEEA